MTKLTKLLLGGGLTTAGAALGLVGSLFYQGNLISTQQYTTASLLNNTQAYEIVTSTGSTATGGLKSGGTLGNYNAIAIPSPMSSTNAPRNGVRAGTGVTQFVQVDIVNATVANTLTCSIDAVSTRGTGGTIVISRTTIGTGTIVVRSTGSVTMGPQQSFRCSLGTAPSGGFSASGTLVLRPSKVIN